MTVEWIIGIIATLAGLFGIAKLLELAFKARLDRQNVQRALDVSNAGKEIDADVNAFDAIYGRLTIVETRLDTVTKELTNQRVENAELKAENKSLKKDNERQEKEIDHQRERLRELSNSIDGKELLILDMKAALKRSDEVIATLKQELHATTLEVHELSRKLKAIQK